MVRLVVELDCTIVVAGYTSTVSHLHRVAVASFFADQYYMEEDMSYPCSS